MRWPLICLLLLPLANGSAQQRPPDAGKQCVSVKISKGEIGEGKLRYCGNATEQEVYLSGEMDFRDSDRSERTAADLVGLKKVIHEFKKRDKGVFRIVTNNAGGGETAWHYMLIMAVEDSCIKDCRIITEIMGRCESACIQLHTTCVRHARTIMHKGAATCDHASTDEENPACNLHDPHGSGETDLCSAQAAVKEYKDRCGVLTDGRGLDIDPERKKQVDGFADLLSKNGVFDTTRLTCTPLPWAEPQATAAGVLDMGSRGDFGICL